MNCNLQPAYFDNGQSINHIRMSKAIGTSLLILFALFLVLGNFPRPHFFSASMGSGNISELVLYFSAFCSAFIVLRWLLNCQLFLILMIGVICSLLVGIIKWGIDTTAVVYSLRLVLQIITSAVIGIFIYLRYSDNVEKFISSYLLVYGLVLGVSYLIILFFPNTGDLLFKLKEMGIEFRGDPHVDRLVSPYLDPNFFGIIIVLPIVLGIFTFIRKYNFSSGLFIAFSVAALFLTVSRSGLSLFFLFLGVWAAVWLLHFIVRFDINSFKLNKTSLLLVSILACATIFLLANNPFIHRVAERFTNISSDASAMARFNSFYIGMDLLSKEPLLGYGYNFSVKPIIELRGIGQPGLDSSIQGLLVNFGLLLGATLILAVSAWWLRINSVLKTCGMTSFTYRTWRLLSLYVVLTVMWAANFNPVLLYPFWLIPILSMLMYFEYIAQNKSRNKADSSNSVSLDSGTDN